MTIPITWEEVVVDSGKYGRLIPEIIAALSIFPWGQVATRLMTPHRRYRKGDD